MGSRDEFGELRALLHDGRLGEVDPQYRWAALTRWLDAHPRPSMECQVYIEQCIARWGNSPRFAPPEWLDMATHFKRKRRYRLANALAITDDLGPLPGSLPDVLSQEEWLNIEHLEIHRMMPINSEVIDALLELPSLKNLTTLLIDNSRCQAHRIISVLSRCERLETLLLDHSPREVDLSALTLTPEVLERLKHVELNRLRAPDDAHGAEALAMLARGCKSLTLGKPSHVDEPLAPLVRPMRFDALTALDVSGYELDGRSVDALFDSLGEEQLDTLVYSPARSSARLLDGLIGLSRVAVFVDQDRQAQDEIADITALASHPLTHFCWQAAPFESVPFEVWQLLGLDTLETFAVETEFVPLITAELGSSLKSFELRGHFDQPAHERVCQLLSQARGLTSISLHHYRGEVQFGEGAAAPATPPGMRRVLEIACGLPALRSLTCINHSRRLGELEAFLSSRPPNLTSLTLDFEQSELPWLLEKMREGAFDGLSLLEIRCHDIAHEDRKRLIFEMSKNLTVFTRVVGSESRLYARRFFARSTRAQLVHGYTRSCWA